MLDEKTIEKLNADFPQESIQVRKSFKNPETGEQQEFVGYKPQYINDRLNEAFGHDCWDWEVLNHGEKEINNKFQVWVWGKFSLYTLTQDKVTEQIYRNLVSVKHQFGTSKVNSMMDYGDALKSACTDALGKCASMFGIGGKAYKGLETRKPTNGGTKEPEEGSWDSKKFELLDICKENQINKEAFKVLQETVFKKARPIEELSIEDMDKLIKHLKEKKSPF